MRKKPRVVESGGKHYLTTGERKPVRVKDKRYPDAEPTFRSLPLNEATDKCFENLTKEE